MIRLLLSILFFLPGIYGCPSLPSSSSWRVSWNISAGTVYFENVNDSTGYFRCSGVTVTTARISFRSLNGGITTTTVPKPEILGVSSVYPFTVSGNSVYSSTSGLLQGFKCDNTTNIRSWISNISSTYACVGLTGATSGDAAICPLYYSNNCNTCVQYNPSCYPCDCDCTSCFGPGPGMCCDIACSSCFGIGNDTCLACNPGYYLQPAPVVTTCKPTCPDGFYGNATDHKCYACSATCATCTTFGNDKCTSCKDGLYLLVSSCVNICPPGMFADPLTSKCIDCHSTCKTCFSASNTSCLTCNNAGSYPYWHRSSCYGICPTGTFLNASIYQCIDCDSSCATCFAAPATNCLSCPSSSYFTPLIGTCTTTCSSPYVVNRQALTCDLRVANAQALESTLLPMIDGTVSSNFTTAQKGDYLSTVSTTIESFYSDTYGIGGNSSSSAACSNCTGNGDPQYSSVYLTQVCQCSSGWTGDCCSISSTDEASLQNIKTRIINQIAQTPLSLTVASTWTQPYLDTLLSLVNPSYCSLSDVQSSMKIVTNIINTDYNSKTTSDIFDKSKMEVAAQIIDSCLACVYKTDCLFASTSSQEVYNSTTELLGKLSVLQLWQKAPDSGTYTLDSTNVLVLSERVSISKLNGHTISPPNSPKVVFQQKSDPPSSGAVDIKLIIWKTNLIVCPNIQKDNNSPPPVSVSLNEPDSLTASTVESKFSAQISYPLINGQAYSNCSSGCKASVSGEYLVCDCQSLSNLTSTSQMKGFFKQSNLYKLAMAAALAHFDYLGAWPFWILWGLLVWIILTLICLKWRIVQPLRYHIKYNFAAGTAKFPHKNHLKMGLCRSLLYGFKVAAIFLFNWLNFNCSLKYGHLITSIYRYEDGAFPRTIRAILLYCRILSIMAFSSLFSKIAKGGYRPMVMLLSTATVTPMNALLKYLLVTKIRSSKMITYMTSNNPEERQRQLSKRNRLKKIAKVKIFIACFLILGIMVACHYIVLVVFANSDEPESKDWAINFLISLVQDMGVSQMFKVILTIVCLRILLATKVPRYRKLAKMLVDRVTVRALAMSAMSKELQETKEHHKPNEPKEVRMRKVPKMTKVFRAR